MEEKRYKERGFNVFETEEIISHLKTTNIRNLVYQHILLCINFAKHKARKSNVLYIKTNYFVYIYV